MGSREYMRGQHIINYIRYSQSAYAMRLALAEIAKLEILENTGMLENIYINGKNTVYTFDNGDSYRVPYNHTALVEGVLYDQDTIIGEEYIRVHSSENNRNEQWWRNLDWSDGLPLTGKFTGLTIPDNMTTFYWVSDWVDSEGVTRKHIRADFDNSDTDLQDKFWYLVHDAEERTEKTLVDTDELALVDSGVDVSINILDFYFRNLYGERGMIVDLDTEKFGAKVHASILHFLRRETPVGSVPIIRIGGQLSADYS